MASRGGPGALSERQAGLLGGDPHEFEHANFAFNAKKINLILLYVQERYPAA
jgi:hypothetical protein